LPKSDATEQVEAELGVKQAALAKANASTRVCGLLMARGRSVEWERALEHISEHFRADPSKESHAVFAKKYRSAEAVRTLLYRAASGPSSVELTRLTVDGRPVGRPAVKIVREFGEAVGEIPSFRWLIIITDARGSLITAYPAEG
jgi:hypothetical protein